MLQNYYEGKIVELCIRERFFVEKMHQKKVNDETLCKRDAGQSGKRLRKEI